MDKRVRESRTLRVLVESLSEMASGGGGGCGFTSARFARTSSVDSYEQSLNPSSFKRKNVQGAKNSHDELMQFGNLESNSDSKDGIVTYFLLKACRVSGCA